MFVMMHYLLLAVPSGSIFCYNFVFSLVSWCAVNYLRTTPFLPS